MTRSRLRLLPALATVLILLGMGCGKDSPTAVRPVPDALPAGTPQNDSPANALLRFEAAYENQVVDEYAKLFASNFIFLFSSEADPDLVAQYGVDWSRAVDRISTQHLFDGFTNDYGEALPGAAVVSMSLRGTTWSNDPDHADSTGHYRVAEVDTVVLHIEVLFGDEPQVYHVTGNQRFSLVRGDAAVLDSSQTSDASRWYIRRWEDLTVPLFGPESSASLTERSSPARAMPTTAASWGSVKALYR